MSTDHIVNIENILETSVVKQKKESWPYDSPIKSYEIFISQKRNFLTLSGRPPKVFHFGLREEKWSKTKIFFTEDQPMDFFKGWLSHIVKNVPQSWFKYVLLKIFSSPKFGWAPTGSKKILDKLLFFSKKFIFKLLTRFKLSETRKGPLPWPSSPRIHRNSTFCGIYIDSKRGVPQNPKGL